jgi:hypothetical protein
MAQRPLPPLCPEARAVFRLQRALSCRQLLAGAGALGLGAVLAGCGTGDSSSKSSDVRPTPAVDSSDTDKVAFRRARPRMAASRRDWERSASACSGVVHQCRHSLSRWVS